MFSMRSWRLLFGKLALAAVLAVPAVSSATTVRLQTTKGNIDIQLFDAAAPLTVANFLNYVNSGAYVNSFIHRGVKGFIIQGGGFLFDPTVSAVKAVPANAPVKNEFSVSRSNLRGTIAMAKLSGNPDSATNQWFFNLADNSSNLDNQNGGFTVFGQVTADGMKVVDAIAALPLLDASNASNAGGPTISGNFGYLPLNSIPSGATPPANPRNNPNQAIPVIPQSGLITVGAAFVLDPRAECLFNWAEGQYAYLFSPAGFATTVWTEYHYRYYSATNAYLGVSSKDGNVYYMGADGLMHNEGPLSSWLSQSGC